MADRGKIVIVVSCSTKCVDPETYDLLSFAQQLHSLTDSSIEAWVIGGSVEATNTAEEIARRSGIDVTAFHGSGLKQYTFEVYQKVLVPLIHKAAPTFICTSNTSSGSEWAPAVAVRIGAGCITGVDGLTSESGRVYFTKDGYGGKVKGRFVSRTTTTVVTTQSGHFSFEPQNSRIRPGVVELKRLETRAEDTIFLDITKVPNASPDISEADVIVAAGNGVRDKKNLALIRRLAGIFPKAAIAGTRIVCDRGWLDYSRQVGVTGTTVNPALYIACGISGASQHLAGMRGAKTIVAINTDRHAPIFSEADICFEEDLIEFIPLVVDLYENMTDDEDTVSK